MFVLLFVRWFISLIVGRWFLAFCGCLVCISCSWLLCFVRLVDLGCWLLFCDLDYCAVSSVEMFFWFSWCFGLGEFIWLLLVTFCLQLFVIYL